MVVLERPLFSWFLCRCVYRTGFSAGVDVLLRALGGLTVIRVVFFAGLMLI